MRWILLDLALVLASVALLGVLLLRLWRTVKALTRAVGRAGELVAATPVPPLRTASPPDTSRSPDGHS